MLLDYYVGSYQSPFFLGVEKGFYKQAGLGSIKIVPGKGSLSTVEQIGHNNYDFGFADAEATALGISKGIPVKVVADYLQQSPLAIITLKKTHMKTPADLVGKSIGVVPGSSTLSLLPAFLSKNHLSGSQVKLQSMSSSAQLGALEAGKVDGITNYDIFMLPLLNAKGYPASELSWAKWGVPGLSLGIIVNDKVLKDHPKMVQAFVSASNKSWVYASTHPQEAVAAENKMFGTPPPGALGTLRLAISKEHTQNSRGKPIGWMSPVDWQDTLGLLKHYMGLKSSDPPSHYYTDRFIPTTS